MDSFLGLFGPDDTSEGESSSVRSKRQNDHNGNRRQQSSQNTNRKKLHSISNQHDYDFLDFDKGALPPEPQAGNIEYKLKLTNPSRQRFEHLVTQMKWRLREGQGEAIYEIGVSDSGKMQGLSDDDMTDSLNTLNLMAESLGATTNVLRRKIVAGQRSVAEVLVRKVPDDQNNIEVRVAVLGAQDAGKSTLLGVLTQGDLDNGRGRARLGMFRHIHEIASGRTSCISHETLGFDSQGNLINYKYAELMTAEEISDKSTKLVTFLDLAGHRRYLKTTVLALSGYVPHHAMVVVPSGGNIGAMTEEHLAIVRALDMPYFVVVTKTDIMNPDETIQTLSEVLTSIGSHKVPFRINSEDDVLTANSHQLAENVVPIFCVSNVTGDGLDLLTKFIHVLSPNITNSEKERLEQEPIEFCIDEIFKVAEVGMVCGGLLIKGVITEGSKVKIGPLPDGSFLPVTIQTIHRNKAPCRLVRAGQSASLSFSTEDTVPTLRAGMAAIGFNSTDKTEPYGSYFFQASVSVLHHATKIFPGFQTTVHIGSIRQTAIIEGIMGQKGIATGSTASVLFRFVRQAEYIKKGMRILFREGPTKGIGTVTQVFPLNEKSC